ncbi:LysR family transcriptional regulator [Kitasatospora aureofaciens]|uniref:LysR family transcriptional regulator n=1 Tax=Kitasatospora aureofaciens TaxID=1894 RepID=A0A1E7NEF8_KITAU|nr:LysR family transcriptional regulator [Kitasatospora aureofaciens]ARF83312.1 LysR family transcriptional regulator [Kitasatospora aureofaciens]OEV39077.1 LysR family transcriptional regulator [Kitasatospora aureofaciens]GGV04616.1 LysR family transcriptional regulator [Kitasatospora aureofaciens]
MLNLERLRVLHAVSTTGSVVGAAQLLHVTTSAISQQIARLEQEIGTNLTERQGRGIRLTEAGTLLAGQAADLLAQVERVMATMAQHRGAVTGSLTIAAFPTAARALLPLTLRALRSRYRDLMVSAREQEPYEAIPAVQRGLLDLAVVEDWTDEPLALPQGLDHRVLFEDTYDIALPADHRLAGLPVLSLADLGAEDWITSSKGQLCHDWLLRSLKTARIAHTASEHPTQIALVAAGLGVAIIPHLGRERTSAPVRFIPLADAPRRRVLAIWRSTSAARPAVGVVVNALMEACSAT